MREKSNTMEIKKTDDMPFIPERIRFFIYEYATSERKPRKFWAEKYRISVTTVSRWLKHAGVCDYIKIVQNEARKGESYLDEIKRKLKESGIK